MYSYGFATDKLSAEFLEFSEKSLRPFDYIVKNLNIVTFFIDDTVKEQ